VDVKIFSSSSQTPVMTSKKHSMQSAGAGLDKLVARSLRKAPAAEVPLLAWPLACGSAVAARTRALDCEDGVLRVEVPDAGWRRELQALAPRYVATLNQYVAEGIRRVEFVVAGRKPASSVPAKKSRSKRA
jgi:predicted nucleic acid-binding Zn ribbon protein